MDRSFSPHNSVTPQDRCGADTSELTCGGP
jgi:hypothetical protein